MGSSVPAHLERFNFDILLRDKFPFQPPLVMTKTSFCEPSLADGRDLLTHILPKNQKEWMPSMNLSDLIQQIPEFVRRCMESKPSQIIGLFHLGLNYDMLLWMSNAACGVFPCQQEQQVQVKVRDKQGNVKQVTRKQMVDIALVVTETVFLMLKIDTKIKNVAKLHAWATLPSLEKVKHSLESND